MRLYRVLIVVLLSWFAVERSSGQRVQSHAKADALLSGNFQIDLEEAIKLNPLTQDSTDVDVSKKSGLQAAAFSMLVPGAGEFYVGDYWKAGSFLTAEVGLWVVYAAYTSKGDDQTALFESFADEHFSVVKYAQWIEQYGTKLNTTADPEKLKNLYNPSNVNAPPWERIYWDRLNAAEAEIGKKTGTFFSHQLPRRPEQQYYELIGKYTQFNTGWDDAENLNEVNFHTALTKRFLDYSQMRGDANDFYNIASTAAKLLVLNHVLSALDAAWTAAQNNKNVTMEAHLVPVHRGFGLVEFVPTARVSVEF